MSAARAAAAARHLAVALLVAAAGATPQLRALPAGGGLELVRRAGVESAIAALPGRVVSVQLTPAESGRAAALWILVRPPRLPRGERTLWRLSFVPAPRLETIGAGLGAWIERLYASDLGRGLELLAGGTGRLALLEGALLDPSGGDGEAARIVERTLVEEPSFAARRFAPERFSDHLAPCFCAVEPGTLRRWTPDGEGGLSAADPIPLPFSVERSPAGLRLSSPPLALTPSPAGSPLRRLFVGPEPLGSRRLRGFWIDLAHPASEPEELLAALPGPESVEQSWPVLLDGTPMVVVRTQSADALNLFEGQRLRVLPWASDRTRAGAAPALAVELDSKRWHTTGVAIDDVDGDGVDDLLVSFPEGLSGQDLVAQWWRGLGGGRFESRARRSDIGKAGGAAKLVARGGPDDPPSLLLVRERQVELRRFVAAGRQALAAAPALRAALPPAPGVEPRGSVEVSVGSGGERVEREAGEDEIELLGAAELDGRAGRELLLVLSGDGGTERLLVVRRAPVEAAAP